MILIGNSRYLDNVFPELFVPGDALASGELRNVKGGRWVGATSFVEKVNLLRETNVCSREMCADSAAKKTDLNKKVGLYPCHNQVITIITILLS